MYVRRRVLLKQKFCPRQRRMHHTVKRTPKINEKRKVVVDEYVLVYQLTARMIAQPIAEQGTFEYAMVGTFCTAELLHKTFSPQKKWSQRSHGVE